MKENNRFRIHLVDGNLELAVDPADGEWQTMILDRSVDDGVYHKILIEKTEEELSMTMEGSEKVSLPWSADLELENLYLGGNRSVSWSEGVPNRF